MKKEDDPKIEKVTGDANNDSKASYSPDKMKIEKQFVRPLEQETPHLYFSSPCLMAEIEDDEGILNQ